MIINIIENEIKILREESIRENIYQEFMETKFLRISNGGICDSILDKNDYFIVECYS